MAQRRSSEARTCPLRVAHHQPPGGLFCVIEPRAQPARPGNRLGERRVQLFASATSPTVFAPAAPTRAPTAPSRRFLGPGRAHRAVAATGARLGATASNACVDRRCGPVPLERSGVFRRLCPFDYSVATSKTSSALPRPTRTVATPAVMPVNDSPHGSAFTSTEPVVTATSRVGKRPLTISSSSR